MWNFYFQTNQAQLFEIVTLNVTKASKFKKGIDVDENILNNGTLTQNGISTFNNEVNLLEYTKNSDTETAEIIIPILLPGFNVFIFKIGIIISAVSVSGFFINYSSIHRLLL